MVIYAWRRNMPYLPTTITMNPKGRKYLMFADIRNVAYRVDKLQFDFILLFIYFYANFILFSGLFINKM